MFAIGFVLTLLGALLVFLAMPKPRSPAKFPRVTGTGFAMACVGCLLMLVSFVAVLWRVMP